jgi:hypothetical protein
MATLNFVLCAWIRGADYGARRRAGGFQTDGIHTRRTRSSDDAVSKPRQHSPAVQQWRNNMVTAGDMRLSVAARRL